MQGALNKEEGNSNICISTFAFELDHLLERNKRQKDIYKNIGKILFLLQCSLPLSLSDLYQLKATVAVL